MLTSSSFPPLPSPGAGKRGVHDCGRGDGDVVLHAHAPGGGPDPSLPAPRRDHLRGERLPRLRGHCLGQDLGGPRKVTPASGFMGSIFSLYSKLL